MLSWFYKIFIIEQHVRIDGKSIKKKEDKFLAQLQFYVLLKKVFIVTTALVSFQISDSIE